MDYSSKLHPCWLTIIIFLSVVFTCTATETISDKYDYKSTDDIAESNPAIEGFIILIDNQKKHSATSIDSKTKQPSTTSRSWLNHTVKTKSKPKISSNVIKTKSLQKLTTQMGNSPARRGRRLLNDFSYDTDPPPTNTSSADSNIDSENFLTVNNDELSQQLMQMAAVVDGSGFTIEDTTQQTSIPSTSISSIATETASSTEVTFTQLSTESASSTVATNQGTMSTETQVSFTYITPTASISTVGQSITSESIVIVNTGQSSSTSTETTTANTATIYTQNTSAVTTETNPSIQSSTASPSTATAPIISTGIETTISSSFTTITATLITGTGSSTTAATTLPTGTITSETSSKIASTASTEAEISTTTMSYFSTESTAITSAELMTSLPLETGTSATISEIESTQITITTSIPEATASPMAVSSSAVPITSTQGSTSSSSSSASATGTEIVTSSSSTTSGSSASTTAAPSTGIEIIVSSSTTSVTGTAALTSITATSVTGTEASTPTTASSIIGTETLASSSTAPVTATGGSASTTAVPVTGTGGSTSTITMPVISTGTFTSSFTTLVVGTEGSVSTTATSITGIDTVTSSSITLVTGTESSTSTTAASFSGTVGSTSTTPITSNGIFTSSSATPATGTEISTSSTVATFTGTGSSLPSSTTIASGTEGSTLAISTSVTGTGTLPSSTTTLVTGTEGSTLINTTPLSGTAMFTSSSTSPVTGTEGFTPTTTVQTTGTAVFTSSSTAPITGTGGATSTTSTPVTGTGTLSSSTTTPAIGTEIFTSITGIPATGTQGSTSTTSTSVTGTGLFTSSSTTPLTGTEGSTSTTTVQITGTAVFTSSSSAPITGTGGATSTTSSPPVTGTGTLLSSTTTLATGTETSTSITGTPVTGTLGSTSTTSTSMTGTEILPSSTTTLETGTGGSTSSTSTTFTGTGPSTPSSTTPLTGTQESTSTTATVVTGALPSSTTTLVTGTEGSTLINTTPLSGTATFAFSSTTPVTGTEGSTSTTATLVTGTQGYTSIISTPVISTGTLPSSTTTPVTGTEGSTSIIATVVTSTQGSISTTTTPFTATGLITSSSSAPATGTEGSTSTTATLTTGTGTFIYLSTAAATGTVGYTSTTTPPLTSMESSTSSATTLTTATQGSTSTTSATATGTGASTTTAAVTGTGASTTTAAITGTGGSTSTTTAAATGTGASTTTAAATGTGASTDTVTVTSSSSSSSITLSGGTESITSTSGTILTSTSTSTIIVTQTTTSSSTVTVSTTMSISTATTVGPTVCTSQQQTVSSCVGANVTTMCSSNATGYQTVETTYTCSNSSLPIITTTQISCTPTCPITEVEFDSTPSSVNLNMRITPVALPFPYQYTNESVSYKTLWVTDKGYITLDKPFYAIEPSVNELPDAPYIAPFWTNLVYVNQTQIKPVIYNGLLSGSDELSKVQETVVRQNQTPIGDEGIVYRVVKIRWVNLITSIDNMTSGNTTTSSNSVLFDAYLINGPGDNFTVWNSYLRFDYNISPSFVSADYQPVIIGYHTGGDTSHKSSVSFTDKITNFIGGSGAFHSYFLSSRALSSCEQWYWRKYTDILYQRAANLSTVKRNPCPYSYAQAFSDFRFYQMNSENRLEQSNNISCFVPLSAFSQRISNVIIYQQTCCYNTFEDSLLTSGEFAGSVLDEDTLISLRYVSNRPQRNEERDACCIANNGSIDWNNWCNLYYQLRPPSTSIGYTPPSQAWFGGDPHFATVNNTGYTCNVLGSFVYAETTQQAKAIAQNTTGANSVYLKALVTNELFSIIARTSTTPSLLQVNNFFHEDVTYFSSFTMYLGLDKNVIIDVSINPNNTYQFQVTYNITTANISGIPFDFTNDYVEYFYYPPTTTNDSSQLPFSIIKENQTLSTVTWNSYTSSQPNSFIRIEVPKLTISTWSGLAMQCYVITNNMACTLLLPDKYTGLVQGLALGSITGDANQYCLSQSTGTINATVLPSVSESNVVAWFNTSASPSYRNYINQVACPIDQSTSRYRFCVHDTVMSQSSLLGQITVKSSSDYQLAARSLSANPPQVTLVSPIAIETPYTYLLTLPYTNTFQNATLQYVAVTVDRTSSITVQMRDGNTSIPRDCINHSTYYSCPFLYTNDSQSQIQLTVIASDTQSGLTTYQKIQLIVNECVNGTAIWNNPTILSSGVSVLFCVCNNLAAGTYCERPVGCTDMTACQLNFISNIICNTNVTAISINNTRAPYFCVNQATNRPCTNNSECCKSGYQFNNDVQQCLWRPVCNDTVCGSSVDICINSELQPNGYLCQCGDNQTSVFNGTTCTQKKICDDPSLQSGLLPCTGKFQIGVDSGNQCTCQCQSGFTNTSTGCNASTVVCNDTTNVCYNTATPSTFFCQYRTQTYDSATQQCQNNLCMKYCQNGTCTANQTGYSCSCPPGKTLDYLLNCAACASGLAGPNCQLVCNCEFGTCNINATSESNKCTCATGYTGTRCNENINYCDRSADICKTSVTHKNCILIPTNRDTSVNSSGYACNCITGYTNNSAAVCQDINECALASNQENICPDGTTSCVNFPGGYRCDCKSGYTKDNTSLTGACVDINECVVTPTICSVYSNSYCVNLRPFYECRCNYGYSPGGDYNQIYVALTGNETCQVYDQCAANGINCGIGHCLNNTSANGPSPSCYCDSPLTLLQLSSSKYDCVCQSSGYYYSNGLCISRPTEGGLDGQSIFRISINCTNQTGAINEILRQLNATFNQPYTVEITNDSLTCDQSGNVTIRLEITTDSNITVQTTLFQALKNVTGSQGIDLYTDGKCLNKTELVTNVTSCYLFDLCQLCGTNPIRGVCLPETHLSQCQCFTNTNDSSSTYTGPFCLPTSPGPALSTSSPTNWTPIIVGTVAGLAGLLCAVTCCLLALAAWRRRRRHPEEDLRIRRIWHLPRAQVPTTVTTENVQTYLNSTTSFTTTEPEESTSSSDRSTYRTTYDHDPNGSINSTFFKQLDQTMGAKLRATITRPDTHAMLSSLPPVTETPSSSTITASDSDDPINDLDAIIDNEDITATFHDPLDDLFGDNQALEVINPNLKIPRAQMNPEPSSFFSFLKRH